MGWSGPYPILCAKRPTASLVSRKVLTPLLGQIALAAAVQIAVLKGVQSMSWYIPPKVGLDKNQIANSENTSLFLVSCYQYIMAAVFLSVGRPYREDMIKNVPFVVTLAVALGVSTWLVIGPPGWVWDLMQLTWMSAGFKMFLLLIAGAGFVVSYWAEKKVFVRLAQWVGWVWKSVGSGEKKRKTWKVLEKESRL